MEKRRLAACCWGEERSATSIVMLDDQGSLVDVLYLPSFSGPQRIIRQGMDYNIHEDPKKVFLLLRKSIWRSSIHLKEKIHRFKKNICKRSSHLYVKNCIFVNFACITLSRYCVFRCFFTNIYGYTLLTQFITSEMSFSRVSLSAKKQIQSKKICQEGVARTW